MEAYDRCVAVYQSMSHCDYSLRVAVTSWSERVKDDMQRLVADKGTRDLLLRVTVVRVSTTFQLFAASLPVVQPTATYRHPHARSPVQIQ